LSVIALFLRPQDPNQTAGTVSPVTDRVVVRRIGPFLAVVAATLAVASVLHLSGIVHGRSEPFDATHAGIAEAIVGAALASGAVATWRARGHARRIGLATIGFAILGFLVGLRFTALGGHAPDIAYHLTVLPVLLASFVLLLRAG
jgi:hypothetical protein